MGLESSYAGAEFYRRKGFKVLKEVPYKVASQVLQLLNNQGPILLDDLQAMASE